MFAVNGQPGQNSSTNADGHAYFAGGANTQPLFDLSSLFKMLGNDKVARILTIFLRDAPGEIKQMKDAYDSRTKQAVYDLAHKLKGSSGHLKANNLFVLLQQIEIAAKNGTMGEPVALAIEAVDCEYKKLEPLLQAELLRLI